MAASLGRALFDLIFSAFAAYNQIGMLIAAAICIALGALFLGNAWYWRLTARRVAGTIVGVVPERGMYSAVFRYALPDGRPFEAKADTATGWLGSYRTGATVRLLVSEHNPAKARKANSVVFDLVGLACLIPGAAFGWTALTTFPINAMTVAVAAALAAYGGWRGYLFLRRNGRSMSREDWRANLALNDARAVDPAIVRTAEDIQASSEFRQEWAQQIRQSKVARIVIGIGAVALIAIGSWHGSRVARLEVAGLRAPGVVVDLREEYSASDDGDGYVYHPVVRFTTGAGGTVEFKDATGSNPPAYRRGDRVTVLYLADNPVGDAIIDSGTPLNAVVPVAVLAIGLFLAWLWFAMRRAIRPDPPLPLADLKSPTSL